MATENLVGDKATVPAWDGPSYYACMRRVPSQRTKAAG